VAAVVFLQLVLYYSFYLVILWVAAQKLYCFAALTTWSTLIQFVFQLFERLAWILIGFMFIYQSSHWLPYTINRIIIIIIIIIIRLSSEK